MTLPKQWREKHSLKKGDTVCFVETDRGLLITTRQAVALKLLDEIGIALKEKKVSLEDLLESGGDIRQKIYDEKYIRTK